MTPYEFLTGEYENVRLALAETLRHDYGPEQSSPYFDECSSRLGRVKQAIDACLTTDVKKISSLIDDLADVSYWIALIERSRLGEFSWPFAEDVRVIAEATFGEKHLNGTTLSPIVHVITEG